MKKIISVVLMLTLVLSLAACGGGKDDIAKVGDSVITKKQVNDLAAVLAFSQNIDLKKFDAKVRKDVKIKLVSQMIDVEALKKYYEKKGKKVLTKQDIKNEKKFLKQAKKEKKFKDFLKKNKISDDVLNYIYESQFYPTQLKKDVEKELKDVKAKAKKEYENNKADYMDIKATASHILVKDKKIADEVYAQTQKGADFAELAKNYGTDGTKDKGGSLGTFGKGEMIPAFEKKVFSMKDGEISKPLKTQFGWHVIKCEKLEKNPQAFDVVENAIIQKLTNEAYEKKLKKIKADSDIEYYNDDYKDKKEKSAKK